MNMQTNSDMAARARLLAAEVATALEEDVAVVVATVDGFDLASAGRRAVDAPRLAAMLSSIAALGDAASQETGIGHTRCLVIESTAGRLVVRCLSWRGESLIVAVLSDHKLLLGRVWNGLSDVQRGLEAS